MLGRPPEPNKQKSTPGPDYAPPDFGTDAPKKSLSSRPTPRGGVNSGSPGPGLYNTREPTTGGPKWTMKGRSFNTRGDVGKEGPGPADYGPNYDAVLPTTGKGVSIGTKPKREYWVKKSNDVGYYAFPNDMGKGGITIGRRCEHGIMPGCFI
jgi:hypothetical protein